MRFVCLFVCLFEGLRYVPREGARVRVGGEMWNADMNKELLDVQMLVAHG